MVDGPGREVVPRSRVLRADVPNVNSEAAL